MGQLKKIISLNQAAKFSGYSQDYLGYLIRAGEIKGKKIGKTWFTTEAEINNYLFRQKIRHKKLAILDFFSRRRAQNIVLITCVVFLGFFSVFFYLLNFSNTKNITASGIVNQKLSEEAEANE